MYRKHRLVGTRFKVRKIKRLIVSFSFGEKFLVKWTFKNSERCLKEKKKAVRQFVVDGKQG